MCIYAIMHVKEIEKEKERKKKEYLYVDYLKY
jgi:hypothetical protein